MRGPYIFFLIFFISINLPSQSNPVYIDNEGVMRWTGNNEGAAFFGVNYTVPFAYGYRSHKMLGLDLKESMLKDINHFDRLDFDAFRVHVWDVEISDTVGNLLENEHLDLFDFLISELNKRGIKTLLTPIAYWGNGYPQRNEDTPGFSNKYGKGRVNQIEAGIKAQERYLDQFFKHVNPYTGKTYLEDENIIAMEINNEPTHGGDKDQITAYINRMIEAIRNTGWTKPIFYNISQNPWCADAVAKSNTQGFAFQWYPTGLVANRTLEGNHLQNVDHYRINFGDTIPEFQNKALMVYEFDCGDVFNTVMYPFMARSFREAGMQWATQFAYDPLATAYGNTEYQTHFVNLVYTPGKAVSLMIAGKVFHEIDRKQTFDDYPQDTTFGSFLISEAQDLSLFNNGAEYIYTNNHDVEPLNESVLEKIVGVGSSPLITYDGTGAYFMKKKEDGIWELEVYPDVVYLNDVYGRASPEREVARVVYQENKMSININEFNDSYTAYRLDDQGRMIDVKTSDNLSIQVSPGRFYIVKVGISMEEFPPSSFVAPEPVFNNLAVYHEPLKSHIEGKDMPVEISVAGMKGEGGVSILLNSGPGNQRNIKMQRSGPNQFTGTIPGKQIQAGIFNYRLIVNDGDGNRIYPGGITKSIYDWDFYDHQFYEVPIRKKDAPIYLFNGADDREDVMLYSNQWRGNSFNWNTTTKPNELCLKMEMNTEIEGNQMGFQQYFGGHSYLNFINAGKYAHLVANIANRTSSDIKIRLALVDKFGNGYSKEIKIEPSDSFKTYKYPLSSLLPDKSLQMPRPYPPFQDLWHENHPGSVLSLEDLQKVELIFENQDVQNADKIEIEVLNIWLE